MKAVNSVTMNTLSFALSFNKERQTRFAATLDSLNKAGDSIAADVIEAHKDGSESAILALVAGIALCKRTFDAPAINALRTASARGRKLHNSRYTLSVALAGGTFTFSAVLSASIARAAGAGRKSTKAAPAPKTTPAQSDDSGALAASAATIQRNNEITQRYAAALRALGMSDAQLRAIASGKLAPESLTLDKPRAERAPRAAASASLAAVN